MSELLCDTEIMRKVGIDAGHRVYGHEGKCASLHGHRYEFEIYARPKENLDDLGRVVDFAILKERCQEWLLHNWDHGMILFKDDPHLKLWYDCGLTDKVYELPYNPTAENLARYFLFQVCRSLLFPHATFEVHKIILWETPNCSATVTV